MKKRKKKIIRRKKIARTAPKKTRSRKSKIGKAELARYKEALLKEREKVIGEIQNITKDTLQREQREAVGDLSGYSFHMADVGTDNFDREFSLGIATAEQKVLYNIDDALRKIKDGAFGDCESCGKGITKKRLKAIPQTRFCLECQRKQEESKVR